MNAVWRHHDAAAEIRQHRAGVTVEFKDRIDRVVVAVYGCAAPESTRAAAFIGPDVTIVGIDVDTGSRAPIPSRREIAPILGDIRGRVRQAFARDGIAHSHRAGIVLGTSRQQDRDTGR